MLVSLKNLSRFVSLEGLTSEQIADGLTYAGVEVEEIKHLAFGTNLVIGEIIECVKHPDSDHLHILKVNLGDKFKIVQIVCGAPNARKGLKVIVARVGAKLPEIEIKQSKIRGVESNGMCCSLRELGVEEKYLSEKQINGIEELDVDAPVGEEKVLEYLGLDDVILNLNVLANRPDLLSIYNVAREVSAIFNREVVIPVASERVDFQTMYVAGSETNHCSQFSLKEVRGIVTKPSPKWLSSALNSLGIRSINNIVDIGNYVMLMTGQPLHMYDADKLPVEELIARDDYEGDFVALDEKTYKVIKGDIVITSDHLPMCLGGVMGSLACAVDEETKNIVIEAASFDSATIRHTSNRLGLVSESSQRFVKGTNHFQSKDVLNLATDLLFTLADAKECSNTVEHQSEVKKERQIRTSVAYINNRLGTEFTNFMVKDALNRLFFNISIDEESGEFIANVPDFRLDVHGPADLSEEVIRLLGYENVKSELPTLQLKLGNLTLKQDRRKNIREYLLIQGLNECLTYSLVSKEEVSVLNTLNDDEPYKIINPLTDEHQFFRTHILGSLLKCASYNVARQNRNFALFELGFVQTSKSRSEHLAMVLVGKKNNRGLLETANFDFFDAKGLLEGIMEIIGIENTRYKLEKLDHHLNDFHPGKSCKIIFQGQQIGVFGELHPNLITALDFNKNPVVAFELDLTNILEAKVAIKKMTSIAKFPSIQRDLSFLIDKNIPVKDVIKTIKMVGKDLVKNVEVFDVYEGNNIASNQKSIAVSVTYQNEKATLVEKEVSDLEDKIKFELARIYRAELRM